MRGVPAKRRGGGRGVRGVPAKRSGGGGGVRGVPAKNKFLVNVKRAIKKKKLN